MLPRVAVPLRARERVAMAGPELASPEIFTFGLGAAMFRHNGGRGASR